MRQKYIIQLWNKQKHHWFDYITFYNKCNASRMYDRLKRNSDPRIHMRLVEVQQYDFEKC